MTNPTMTNPVEQFYLKSEFTIIWCGMEIWGLHVPETTRYTRIGLWRYLQEDNFLYAQRYVTPWAGLLH